ncbi:MAG: hypothetical protein HUU25_12465 [Candidatus Sumerlaeia bacterium]|nr:hypothetical protein [Candidatus Sumerlaeia bacterium]
MHSPRRPLWLWPVGLLGLWVLALPLALVVMNMVWRGNFVPSLEHFLDPFGRRIILVPWIALLATLTVATYTASFWRTRARRPRLGPLLLMGPWSLFLGTWWFGVNRGDLRTAIEWLLFTLFVLGPPLAVFLLEEAIARTMMSRGMALYRRGESIPAVRLLRLALLLRPGDHGLSRIIGLAYFRAREWEQAEEWLTQARRAFPRDIQLAWPLATLALRREAWEEAIPLLREHLEHSPRDQQAWERLAEAHLALRQREQAIRALEHLEREDIPLLIRIADLAREVHDHDKALSLALRIRDLERPPYARFLKQMERLLEERPTMVPALEAMARHAEQLGLADDLQRWRERILVQRPHEITLRRVLMDHYRQTNQIVALQTHLRWFLENERSNLADWVEMIELFVTHREWEGLAAWLPRAQEAFPDAWEFFHAEAHLALVRLDFDRCHQLCHMARARAHRMEDVQRVDALLARLSRARSQNQLEALRQAIETSPDPMPLRWELVERLTELCSFDALITELDEIIRQDRSQQERVAATLDHLLQVHPNNFILLTYLRDLLLRERAHDAVFRTTERLATQSLHPDQVMRDGCERILNERPDHVLSLEWLAREAHRRGDWERAVSLLDQWFLADPPVRANPENQQLLFEALCQSHDLERAVETSRDLLRAHHREVENLKRLATLYQHHGQLLEAQRCFVRAREIDSQDRDVHQAIRTLDAEIRLDRVHEIQVALEKAPDDTALHHELGDLFYSFQRYTEAIPHLQRAAADTAIANLCRAKIAHALALRGMLDLAHETLQEVTLRADDPDTFETLKAIHFNVAEIFREEAQYDKARDAFKRLFRVDAGYRNVVQKLEALTK